MKTKIKKKEIVWYSIAGFIAFVGLFFLILGIVGENLNVLYSDNWILYSEPLWLSNWSGMGYRYWGLILFLAGSLLAIVCLSVFARETDRDSERASRRAQRLAMQNQASAEANKEEAPETK